MSAYMYCATEAGVTQHIRDGESCPVCKDWMRQVGGRLVKGKLVLPAPKQPKPYKQRVTNIPPGTPRKEIPCGTIHGYDRHKRLGQDPCDPCREKYNAFKREERRRKRLEQLAAGLAKKKSKHGDPADYPRKDTP